MNMYSTCNNHYYCLYLTCKTDITAKLKAWIYFKTNRLMTSCLQWIFGEVCFYVQEKKNALLIFHNSYNRVCPTPHFLIVASVPVHLKKYLHVHWRAFNRSNWKSFFLNELEQRRTLWKPGVGCLLTVELPSCWVICIYFRCRMVLYYWWLM